MRKPHNHKNTRNSLLMIQMKGASNDCVEGQPGANISDGPGGVTAPGSKSLVKVDNISGSRGGWGKFMGPKHILRKVGRNLRV